MNHIYRVIWSEAQRAWVVASELTKAHGKRSRSRTDVAAPTVSQLLIGGFAALLISPSWAVDRYWDVNQTAPGSGGTGLWNLSNLYWTPNSSDTLGPYNQAWNNAALDHAIFSGTAGEITLGAPITVNALTFNTNGYSISGTGGNILTLAGTTPTITVTTGTSTISAVLAGSAGLTKSGAGALYLTGANTFSGGITLSGGTLQASNDAALGAIGNAITTTADATLTIDSGSTNRTVTIGAGTTLTLNGAGAGSALLTGSGNLNAFFGTTLSNDNNDFTGTVTLSGWYGNTGSIYFTSVRNVGEPSSLGAGGTITFTRGDGQDLIRYIGDGDVSNRDWVMEGGGLRRFLNEGTGTLSLSGGFNLAQSTQFQAVNADFELLGILSGGAPAVTFVAGADRSITLAGANTFTGNVSLSGGGVINASVLANAGLASSLGQGSAITITSATLRYTGAAASTDRPLTSSGNSSIVNDGDGALSLTGDVSLTGTLTLGGTSVETNTASGVISGAGGITSAGNGAWELTGANTYTGATTVDGGTLRAGSAGAFGGSTSFVVNAGTLDLNDFDLTMSSLSGMGGTVALGTGDLTVDIATGQTRSYGGSITGSGSFTKLGDGTLTLTGANDYSGDTNIGGGTLALDFAADGAPIDDIISSSSTLIMSGGTVQLIGAEDQANSQTFDGLNITAGSNRITAAAGAEGTMTVNYGAVSRSSGQIDFGIGSGVTMRVAPGTTLGGWATVNGSDYAALDENDNIIAFTAYALGDDASTWADNEVVTDTDGAANTAFTGTVSDAAGDNVVQLGGLRYTAAQNSQVDVGTGQTLGVDGTIIIASDVGSTSQTISGGSVRGASGGVLGIQQNSAGTFTINSTILDNGGATGLTIGGTGTGSVVLGNAANTYSGATWITRGKLSVGTLANGGVASSIGDSSADASNLVLEGGTLSYTGGNVATDRGFTLMRSGAVSEGTIEVTQSGTNLIFGGEVVSSDGAGLVKTGAGTLTLSNEDNSYTGITSIRGGTLAVTTLANGGEASSIGASSSSSANLVIGNGARLQYDGDTAESDRGFTLGTGTSGAAVSVTSSDTTLTLSGNAVGANNFVKEGAGTLVLAGNNTQNSNTVSAGTLRAGSGTAFGRDNGLMTVASGARLELATFSNTVGGLLGSGTVDLGALGTRLTLNSRTAEFTGTITGAGELAITGGAVQTLDGCNHTYTGATHIWGGTLSTNCIRNGSVASGIGASSADSGYLQIGASGFLRYTGGDQVTDRGITLPSGWGYVDVTQASTELEFEGDVVGAGGLAKRGLGTLILSGTNTHTTGTAVEAGTLIAGSAQALGSGYLWIHSGATVDMTGFSNTVYALSDNNTTGGEILIGDKTLTLNGGSSTFAGRITGTTGELIKNGGTQTLTGCSNNYGGRTVIDGGWIAAACLADGDQASSIGASSNDASNLVIGRAANAGLQYIGDGDTTDRSFTLGAADGYIRNDGTGALEFTNTEPVSFVGTGARRLRLGGANTATNIMAAELGDNGASATSLLKEQGGTWRLTSTSSSYTGATSISDGVLEVVKLADGGQASSIGGSIADANRLGIGTNARLRYVGTGDSTNRLFTLSTGTTLIESSGTGAINFTNSGGLMGFSGTGARTFTLGGTYTGDNIMGVTIRDQSASAQTSLAKNDAGTWILTADNTYTGNTVINDGKLIIGNGGMSGNVGTGQVILAFDTGTLGFNRSDTFNFAGQISGPGIIEQMGEGTTVLTATNSAGTTTISEGALQIDGDLTTDTITFNDDEATTLIVNGAVHGNGVAAVIAGDGSSNIININAGGTLAATGDLGGGSDIIDVLGTLDTGASTLSLGAGDDIFTLNDGATISGTVDAGSAVTGDTLRINNALAGTFDGTGFSDFELLTKQNTGVLMLTGTQTFSLGTNVTAGTLDVDGTLNTGAITLFDNTTLNVDGTIDASSPLTGSSGTNTVLVSSGATLSTNGGDLGDGSDVITVAGTLDTGAGTLNLGAGDDTVTLNDGALLSGTGLNAGAGTNDELVLNNASALTFDGGMTAGFEQLVKQNTGTATMTGTQTFAATTVEAGALDIDGTLDTATVDMADSTTLNIDGAVQAAGATQTTITGSAGANTLLVNSGATLRATGDLGDGSDIVTLSGALNTGAGALSLGAGDDTLTLTDGATIAGTGVDAAAGANDRLVLNNASALTFAGNTTTGFEQLIKQNTGVATMTGTQTFAGTTISGGTLDVDGSLNTASVALADGTTLNVDGTVQAAGATQTSISGDAGANTVVVNDGATLLATGDLGAGADVLDVVGTLDTGGGTLSLGDGDDSFVVHDGTTVLGTVDGGAGNDTRVYNINLTASVGALVGFEGLTKNGTGTLNINGPGSSALAEVEVQGGTLNVASGAAIDGAVSTSVTSGATLNIDGVYNGSSGNDTFTVAGTVSGAGDVNLGAGDDVLTIHDGAAVNVAIDGGADTAGDRVVLDNGSALTFDGTNVAGFEELVKQNSGTATLAGTHTYDTAAVNAGTLAVAGTLNADSMTLADGATLDIAGTVQGAGATQTSITGTSGVNTVIVNDGATLLASGDLGDGNDVLDVAGTLDTGAGVFSLGAGDDIFVVHDTTQVIGTLDAGAGNDQLNVNVSSGNLVPLGSTTGFESLGKSGVGTLEINGASDFVDVQVQAGVLDVAEGGSVATQTANVSADATLNVDGAFNFTAGADTLAVAGAITGSGTVNMLDGDDQLTILDGADLSGLATSLDGGAGNDTLTANITTDATLGGVTGFETLTKQGVGTLNIAGPASSSFGTVDVQDGTVDVASGATVSSVTATTVASGATLNIDGNYAGSAGNDSFNVAGTVSGAGTIGLGAGDDVLTIQDGAALNMVIDGGADAADDRVVLDNAAAFTLNGTDIIGFEQFVKQNAGTATLAGSHTYDGTTIAGGTVDVDGALATDTASLADGTTLNVDGTMQGASGAQAVITGSAGVNTVVVNASATLAATGDLGDGADVLDVAGTLDAGGGNFNLGAGDDTFVIHDGTTVLGTVVGGAGLDTRVYDIAGVANVGALQEFEGLTKRNAGTLNINGPATTDLLEVAVEGGTLNIAAVGNVAGVQATTVDAGATLNVDGAYAGSAGDDTFTVAGIVSGTGNIDLGDGNDVLTLQDGAVLSAVIDGGNAVGGDTVVLDNASDFTFDGTNVTGFEQLVKQNTGTATLVGTHMYDSTSIDSGTLDVDGTLETATVALADDATLNVDGSVQAAGATQTAITGSTGVNSIIVNSGSTLLATGDLGDGNDVLDVAGTFDTGGGTFFLGAGDDIFVVHDGTTITGTIDGGDGLDTRVYNINSTATLGALTNFEGLTKTGSGVLTIQGPASSDLAEVEVLDGTLDIEAGGGITGITNASVGAGATLNVNGAFDFTAGADVFEVAGTITGATAINMLDGDDRLTLSDGADLSGLASPLDGGAGTDTLIADIATTATLGGVSSFENLTKEGAGTLNVAASAAFETVLVDAGVLDVATGATVEASTATVSEGATVNLAGDLMFTPGADSFTVAGTVAGAGSIDMLDGDDQLIIQDGADLSGLANAIDGGDGDDTLTVDIATRATLGGAIGFETLIKQGVGVATIAGPANSMFDTVQVSEGELHVGADAFVDPTTTSVDAGATMTIDGIYHGTADADTFTLSGTLAGSGAVDLLEGDDVLTVNTGADVTFTGVFDANAASNDRFVLAGTGEDSFDLGLIGTVFQNFDEFHKEGTGTWRLTGAGSNDWTVTEGTLIGDTESFGGNIANAATVVFDQSAEGTYAGVISGNGTLIKENTGTLILSGTHTFSGNTQIAAGTLEVNGVLPSAIAIASGATLSGIGTVGTVNAPAGSVVAPGTANLPFGTLTIAGDYSGGGTVRFNTVLGNETSDTGRLVIQGNVSGTSTVLVNRWSGNGAMTQGDGIEVIQVDGTSAADSFRLGQAVQAGAYEYLLYQGGSSDANDWYLRSELIDPSNPPDDGGDGEEPPTPAFRAGVPGYVLGHQANLEYGFTALGNLRARVGDQGRMIEGQSRERTSDAWMRVYADELDVGGTRFEAQDLQMATVQFGTDIYSSVSGNASTHFGLMASVGESSAMLFDNARAIAGLPTFTGQLETDAKGVGMYWTHYAANGAYVDLSAQALHYTNRYRDQTLTDADQGGWGGTVAAEIGNTYALGGTGWLLEPGAQVAYQRLELDSFHDGVSRIEGAEDDGVRARADLRLLRTPSDWLGMSNASPYIGLGVQHDFRRASAVAIAGTTLNDEIPDTTGDVSIGFTGNVLSGVELHLDMRYQKATEGERDGLRANFGFRMMF